MTLDQTPTRTASERHDVVIVGAGPAGLAVGACLRREGIDFVILEREASVAPAWRRHYDRLHLHTPQEHSHLPHLPFSPGTPRYPGREDVLAYLEAYARHFLLSPHFGQAVREITRSGDAWTVRTNDRTYRARHVVLAAGYTHRPVIPTWPGLDGFPGAVLHSAAYRTGLPFKGARVLVVGAGNSGQEIALDLTGHGAHVTWSVRGPVNVVPRDVLGRPSVHLTTHLRRLPPRLADALTFPVRWLRYRDLRLHGLRPLPFGPLTQIARKAGTPMIDIGIARALRDGVVRVRPGVSRFEGRDVTFTDGTREPVDAVILATGFAPADPPVSGEGSAASGLHRCGYTPSPVGMLQAIREQAPRIAARIRAAMSPATGP